MTQLDRRQFVAALAAVPVLASCARAVPAEAQAESRAQTGGGTPASAYNTRPLRPAGAVPLVGIGTARLYQDPQTDADYAPLRETVARFVELGGKVIDTAPSYGRAEEVLGKLTDELGVRDRLYLATKVGADTLDEGKAQIEQSFANLRTDFIDLIAVHNLRDTANHLAYLRDLRAAGRVGAVGITTSFDGQYDEFVATMEREEIDCIQVDYALDNRNAADRILPLAQERDIPAMINLPFGRGRLFSATEGMALPDWAAEIGAQSWAQVFLKYIVSHPARPIAIPGTDKVRYVDDNLGAARGSLPDAALRTRMEAFIDGL